MLLRRSIRSQPRTEAGGPFAPFGLPLALSWALLAYAAVAVAAGTAFAALRIHADYLEVMLPTSPTDESIVRAIVSLAHSVGLQVVAEGVETAEQLERIRALECDQWQGYYCCPPQPAAALAERLVGDAAISSTGLRAALTRASRLLGP
jgi:predicted signal transduction protein with EAL and GGDEF domain